ncbi:hypothetical protein DRO66_06820 [Candidatus Bathyarchaeota archaeon]|nr:MAG: hypothetical protein DRO66_06820 [Candidatus Bathyarchaeota archaeon]
MSSNPIIYYKIVGPGFHRELLGFSRPANVFELMGLIGSEAKHENFQKVRLDDHYLSYLTLKQLGLNFPHKVTGNEKYPWFKLVDSIKEDGLICPLIVEMTGLNGYMVFEGKHRFAAISLIEPFDSGVEIPCLVTKTDELYTVKMFKQEHPNPFCSGGFATYAHK